MDGRQFFRQYYAFNQYAILKRLKQLERKFGRLILLFIDRAPQHYRSIKVKKHLEEHHNAIRIEYLPKVSPEFNAIEEC
jgi:transposase